MNSQKDLYEALISGKQLQGERLPHRAVMLTDGSIAVTKDYGRSWDTLIGGLPEHHTYWSLREELKKPRVAEAFVHTEGAVRLAIPGSADHEHFLFTSAYTRAAHFDIVEKSE